MRTTIVIIGSLGSNTTTMDAGTGSLIHILPTNKETVGDEKDGSETETNLDLVAHDQDQDPLQGLAHGLEIDQVQEIVPIQDHGRNRALNHVPNPSLDPSHP